MWVTRPILILVITLLQAACTAPPQRARIEPVYDNQTGKLQLLKYDADGNGVFDTFSYMDGSRVVRIEIDRNEDGRIERWEYYGPDQKLQKVGFSRAQDGKEDAWSHYAEDGTVDRIDVSTARDGSVTRVEHFEHGALVRAEEDSDHDGRIDKWETYEGDRLASVAFDSRHRGAPDRRFVYGIDGSAHLEADESGNGRFVAVPDRSGEPAPR